MIIKEHQFNCICITRPIAWLTKLCCIPLIGLIADRMGFNAAYLAIAIVNGATFILVVIFKYFEKRRNHASDKSMVTSSGLK